MSRSLNRPACRLLALAVLALGLLVAYATGAAAQGLGTPPARFFGSVAVAGRPAPAGAQVNAVINGVVCGTASVGFDGAYILDAHSAASQAGCGTDGATVTFTVDGRAARESATYRQGAFIERQLSVASVPPGVAEVVVERWAWYDDEPCAHPVDGFCIQTFRLPAAPQPFARYRMLVELRNGRVIQPVDWITVTPGAPTPSVNTRATRGVVRVIWERWTFSRLQPCQGRIEGEWCVERVVVPPPYTGTVWYRLLVTQPNGSVDDPTGYIAVQP
jgi:hypothetical protein